MVLVLGARALRTDLRRRMCFLVGVRRQGRAHQAAAATVAVRPSSCELMAAAGAEFLPILGRYNITILFQFGLAVPRLGRVGAQREN